MHFRVSAFNANIVVDVVVVMSADLVIDLRCCVGGCFVLLFPVCLRYPKGVPPEIAVELD